MPILTLCELKPAFNAMSDQKKNRPSSFQPSMTTDTLRPAALLAGVQLVIALLGAILLTNGVLA